MKTFHSFIAPFLCGTIVLLCTSCDLLGPIFNPKKEFVFPLTIGNKWVYDYRGTGIGTTTWEVIEQKNNTDGKYYSIQQKGEGIYNSQPYFYTDTFAVIQTSRYTIISAFGSSDTITRFTDNTVDTVKIQNGSDLSGSKRFYTNNTGLVYYAANGGSPASGRWSVSLKLRSYALKP